jgi:hypothetical protein
MPIEIKQPSKYKCSVCNSVHDSIENCIKCENRGITNKKPIHEVGDIIFFWGYEIDKDSYDSYHPGVICRKVKGIEIEHHISYILDETYYEVWEDIEEYDRVSENSTYIWIDGVCDLEEEHSFLKVISNGNIKIVKVCYDEKGWFYYTSEKTKNYINDSDVVSYLKSYDD